MNTDDFEERLGRQSMRPIPRQWRGKILDAALRASSQPPILSPQPTAWWREWLWPCPQAWAGLAAVWMLLLGLHITAPSRPSALVSQSPSPEKQTDLAAQRRELAKLLDAQTDPAPSPKPSVPGPRSERPAPLKV